jgi:hypothetical protein
MGVVVSQCLKFLVIGLRAQFFFGSELCCCIMGAQASKQVVRKFPQQANPETLTQVPKTSPSSTHSPSHLNSTQDTAYIADGKIS